MGFGAANQYMQLPSLETPGVPGVPGMPGVGGDTGPTTIAGPTGVSENSLGVPGVPATGFTGREASPFVSGEGTFKTISPYSPDFYNQFIDYIGSNLAGGASPYSLPAYQPSTGRFTEPGQLTSSLSPLLQSLQGFFMGKGTGGIPGLQGLQETAQTGLPSSFAETGEPVNVIPAWQSMVDAQERNLGKGAANLREQFGFSGNLKGSPFGQAMVDYETQARKDQNATLGELNVAALESAMGRKLTSQETAKARQSEAIGMLTQGASQLASALQTLDQSSIQATLAEFVRTRPEYGPLLNIMFALATTFPPVVGDKGFGLGATGAALSGAADVAGVINDIFNKDKDK